MISLKELQQSLIGTTTAFASFRKPGESDPETIIDKNGFYEISGIREIFDSEAAFVMAPFLKPAPVLALNGEKILHGTTFESIDLENPKPVAISECNIIPPEKDEYIRRIAQVVSKISEGKADKVVISRPIETPFPNPELAADLFGLLCEEHPTAFVYLVWMPGYGLWAGATPELLLDVEQGKVSTMALAGTRSITETGDWGEKEIDEHEWVCRHIEEKMAASGCTSVRRAEKVTVPAARVSHLKTAFTADSGADGPGQLAEALHPTPAVCGWPEEKARNIILETEGYDRSFYTGFLGPIGGKENASLFVNLRCMQIFAGKAVIYAGGGITAASDPESEWKETELKSLTLLNPIRKMQNFAF